jgi:hypothetical protein
MRLGCQAGCFCYSSLPLLSLYPRVERQDLLARKAIRMEL